MVIVQKEVYCHKKTKNILYNTFSCFLCAALMLSKRKFKQYQAIFECHTISGRKKHTNKGKED